MVVIINMFYYDSNFHHDYTWYNYSNGWQLQVQLVRVFKKKKLQNSKAQRQDLLFFLDIQKKTRVP